MFNRQIKYHENRQWRMLLVYDLYRLVTIFIFLSLYLFGSLRYNYSIAYLSFLAAYFVFALLFLYLWNIKKLGFQRQVLLSGTVDVIAISSMLNLIGTLQSGYGILLNVTIAVLSILVPGRLAIFFASLASSLLLLGNVIQYAMTTPKDLGTFFDSGIYCTGFFATALTAWYLANWVRISENLAQDRSDELAGMQRISEYIVERLHSGIIYVDDTKNIRLINSAARKFLRVSRHLVPHDLREVSLLLAGKMDNFLEKIKNNELVAQTVLEDPFLRVHFFSTAATKNPEILIILEDMTYIGQQAQQLKLAALGRFSASIAHELRNPLGAIAHAAQLLGDEGTLNTEDLRLKQLIMNNCDRMNGVIKNVLQLSRRQQSQAQLIEIHSFLEQFKLDFCHNNLCNMKLKLPKNKHFSLFFDKSQLEQILVILCDNAMQHGGNSEGVVDILICIKSNSYQTELSVSDAGKGIPSDHVNTIFEPFFTTLRSGTGMGLFIARDLCEINQSRLNLVKSKKGACFRITINPADELLI